MAQNIDLQRQLAETHANQQLVNTTIKIFGFEIQYRRLPSADAKSEIIKAINLAGHAIPLEKCLSAIGLSMARFRHWCKRQVQCLLQDQPSCPRVVPSRMTVSEVGQIKELFTAKEFAHYSVLSLSFLAKRLGKVFASPATWSRVIRESGLSRCRKRIYPPRPQIGIRAIVPNQIWHLDQTIIRLSDHSRVFIQSIIDNYSRYVLAWHNSLDYGGVRTRNLLLQALQESRRLGHTATPLVMVDSGSENINAEVNALIAARTIDRVIAQIEVIYSNSMVEMLFYRLKNRFLYYLELSSLESVTRNVDFIMNESNHSIPLAALKGLTLLEAFTGYSPDKYFDEMSAKSNDVRKSRAITNRLLRCQPCIA